MNWTVSSYPSKSVNQSVSHYFSSKHFSYNPVEFRLSSHKQIAHG